MSGELGQPTDLEHFRISQEYVATRGGMALEEFEDDFDVVLQTVGRIRTITPDTKLFEVGAGLGWFEIICAKRGLRCSAIDSNPVIFRAALEFARREGVDVDITLGDIADTDLGRDRYDVIVAQSVFEHVRHYGRGLARIYEALRPGGVFYFSSTNKFSLRSGEYPDFPLYGWFPYSVRQRIRVSRQGRAIVESAGIDCNQFTYWGLARHLRSLGFSRVLDRVDYLEPNDASNRSAARNLGLRAAQALGPVGFAARAFASGTCFLCVK